MEYVEQNDTIGASLTLFQDEDVRTRFFAHYETIRGAVRTEIVRRHLCSVIPNLDSSSGLRILDVGCGDGRDARWLASLGHDVIGFDSVDEMVDRARVGARGEDYGKGSVEFAVGTQKQALDHFGSGGFDLVLSHGVLMYHQDEPTFINEHLELVKPMGYFSILCKNASGMVFRAAYEGQFDRALELVDDTTHQGHLGLETRAHTVQQISDWALQAGGLIRSWAGVRIVSDVNPVDAEMADIDKVVELEWRLATREPHRRVGALFHALVMKGLDLSLLPSLGDG